MASAAPSDGLRGPTKPQSVRPRVPVAIPLHYPNHRRGASKVAGLETTTPAKSEKSDSGSGDERILPLPRRQNGGQHPMTPESLTSSIHKPDGVVSESRDEAAPVSRTVLEPTEHVNGEFVLRLRNTLFS
jgi:hypothetical protein